MVAKILIICTVLGMSQAATWMGLTPEKPAELAHKDGCFVKEINDVIPFGEYIEPIGYCYRIGCGARYMDYASCGVIDTDDKQCYKTKTDLSKPYPLCCPTIKCEIDNNV